MRKQNLMFDIDGTLIQSFEFDEAIFIETVKTVSDLDIDTNWELYPNVTDTGLIHTFCSQHGLLDRFDDIHHKVKQAFIQNTGAYLKKEPAKAIPGAREFIDLVNSDEEYLLSFATGGWRETALLKLESAGIEINPKHLRSSNDDYRRTHIMQAAQRSNNVVYFGDALWDKQACAQLSIPFIAVGDRVSHSARINDFKQSEKVLKLIEALTKNQNASREIIV